MIKEAYVSFETAKLLKEKGFDWKTQYVYTEDGTGSMPPKMGKWKAKSNIPKATHQMVMAWLREKGIFFCIHPDYPISKNYMVEFYDDGVPSGVFGAYDTYEDAVEAAIEYSLKNLI